MTAISSKIQGSSPGRSSSFSTCCHTYYLVGYPVFLNAEIMFFLTSQEQGSLTRKWIPPDAGLPSGMIPQNTQGSERIGKCGLPNLAPHRGRRPIGLAEIVLLRYTGNNDIFRRSNQVSQWSTATRIRAPLGKYRPSDPEYLAPIRRSRSATRSSSHARSIDNSR